MVVLMKRIFVTYFSFSSALSHDVLLQLRTSLRNTEHGFLVLLVVLSPFIDAVFSPLLLSSLFVLVRELCPTLHR